MGYKCFLLFIMAAGFGLWPQLSFGQGPLPDRNVFYIQGQVVDTLNEGIPFANVFTKTPLCGTSTDFDGFFAFTLPLDSIAAALSNGYIDLHVHSLGYTDQIVKVPVAGNSHYDTKVVLIRDTVNPKVKFTICRIPLIDKK